jgi:hypothetical protein
MYEAYFNSIMPFGFSGNWLKNTNEYHRQYGGFCADDRLMSEREDNCTDILLLSYLNSSYIDRMQKVTISDYSSLRDRLSDAGVTNTATIATEDNKTSYQQGEVISVIGTVSDYGFNHANFYLKNSTKPGAAALGAEENITSDPPTASFMTTELPPGKYYIYMVAYFSYGAEKEKKPFVEITVSDDKGISPTRRHFQENRDALYAGIPIRERYEPPSGTNPRHIQIVLEPNDSWDLAEICIDLFVEFEKYNSKAVYNNVFEFRGYNDDIGKTYREVIEEGVLEYWNYNCTGNVYDFESGVSIRVTTRIHSREEGSAVGKNGESFNANQKFIPVRVADVHKSGDGENDNWFRCDSSASEENIDDVYYRTGLTRHYDVKRVRFPTNSALAGPIDWLSDERAMAHYRRTAAHEFGHVLGLNDGYKAKNIEGNDVKRSVKTTETPKNGLMMDHNKGTRASANDVEMVLFAFADTNIDNKQQSFRTFRYIKGIVDDENRGKITVGENCAKSEAVRHPKVK